MAGKQTILRLVVFLCFSLVFMGCAAEEPSENLFGGSSDEKMAVADWGSGGQTLQSRSRMVGDTLYYADGKWDNEKQQESDTVIYRKQEGTEPELAAGLGKEQLIIYSVDSSESVYLLYRDVSSEEIHFGVRKFSKEGEILYDTVVDQEELSAFSGLERVCAGEVDDNGNLCLMNVSGVLYILDASGRPIHRKENLWGIASDSGSAGLFNAGKDGVYAYQIKDRKLMLKRVNPEEGSLEEGKEIALPEESSASLEVFSGYDSGILIADSDSLWAYDIANEKLSQLLSWGDSTVNLKDYQHDAIGILPDGTV